MKKKLVPVEKNPVGRPCKYETHVLPRLKEIEKWIAEGMTEYSICDQLGISHQAWIEYKRGYPELMECFTRARDSKNHLVQHRQFQKATGMTVKLKKQKLAAGGKVVDLEEETYIPPDTNAAEFFARHNDPAYVSPRVTTGNVTLIQNNFNRTALEKELQQLNEELKQLEAAEVVEAEILEEKKD